MKQQIKPKKCAICKETFAPQRPLQKLCSIECAIKDAKSKQELKAKKQANVEKIAAKKAIMTHKDWLNLCQKVFNTYIRARDKNKPCICCNLPLTSKYDAGHFYSVGGNPELRFNEDNCHAQRVDCNQHKHGNLLDYAENLPKRIGIERFEALKASRNKPVKYSISEIEEMISYYRKKTKELN